MQNGPMISPVHFHRYVKPVYRRLIASVQQVEALIREEVEKLGSPKGGLMMIYGLYPGVPPANIDALADAMERYAIYYA